MIQAVLDRVLREYLDAKIQPHGGHPLASFLRNDAPVLIREAVSMDSELEVEGSPGRGVWVSSPWIAVFDRLVTESAQEGYYPVYLFAPSMERVYLSFNQGGLRALGSQLHRGAPLDASPQATYGRVSPAIAEG